MLENEIQKWLQIGAFILWLFHGDAFDTGGKDQFVQMLEGVSDKMEKKTKVTIQRRKGFDESDDDNDDDLR